MPIINGVNYNSWGGYEDYPFATLIAQHGGEYITPLHSYGAGFRLGRVGPQMVFVDPDGKLFIPKGLFHITDDWTQALGGTSQNGRSLKTTVANKYSGAGTTYLQALGNRFRALHMNTSGPFSFSTPSGVPVIVHPTGTSGYAKHKPFATGTAAGWAPVLTDAVKDIPKCMKANAPGNSELFYIQQNANQGTSVQWGDWLDPKWKQWVEYQFAAARFSLGSNQIAIAFEESDFVSRWINMGSPNERPGGPTLSTNGYNNVHAGMGILWSSLVVASAQSPRDGVVYTYTDTVNYSKAKLIANLKAKYNNSISALNAAWGTNNYYTSFDSAGGWGVGTGVADEDGLRPRVWFGLHSPSITGHTKGSNNNCVDSTSWGNAWPTSTSGAPNLTNNVKIDLDQIMSESVTAWIKPVWDVLVARDPGVILSPINNFFPGGRPATVDAIKPYSNLLTGATGLNYRTDFETTEQDARAYMDWLWGRMPVAHIANYYSIPDRIDGCQYYMGANGWLTTNTEMGQRTYNKLINLTFDYQAPDGTYPHAGYLKWECYDNMSESLHWGCMSLNDNLYDGGNYTIPGQVDKFAPDRIIRTEDNVYTDMWGFSGTNTLQRSDLIIGAHIESLNKFLTNMADTVVSNITMTASPISYSAAAPPVNTFVTAPFKLNALPVTYTTNFLSVGTAKGTVAGTFTDTFTRADNTNLGADWTEVTGDLRIISGQCFPAALGQARARRTADQGHFDHYAQAKVYANSIPFGNAALAYVEIRGNATDQACYGFGLDRQTNGSYTANLYRRSTSGARTLLGSVVLASYTTGSIIRLEGVGSSLTGKIAGATVVGPVTDTTITSGQRTGFANMCGTNSTSDFVHDDFQSGNLGVLANTIMTASPLSYAVTLSDVTTSAPGIRMAADTLAYTTALQNITLTPAAKKISLTVMAFTLTQLNIGTFRTTTVDPGIFLARVLRFVPGRTLLLIVRATVPSGQEFFYADPEAVSLHPEVPSGGTEETALRAGTIVEKRVSVTAPVTFANLQLVAEAEQAAFQAEVDASDITGMTGLYGVGTRWSGEDWG